MKLSINDKVIKNQIDAIEVTNFYMSINSDDLTGLADKFVKSELAVMRKQYSDILRLESLLQNKKLKEYVYRLKQRISKVMINAEGYLTR